MSFYEELLEPAGAPEPSGRMSGIVLGEVKENWDKEHPGMVKVQILLGEEENNELGWIPVAAPYAGKETGFYCLPEIGSQVLLAFHMGDLKSPYVIGSVWNKDNVLPSGTADEKNTKKTMLTKGGNQITISDEEGKEKITVKTKGELTISLDDENQKLELGDKDFKNGVRIDAKEGVLTLLAEKKAVISVNSKELLVLDGNGKKADLKTDQINIEAGQKLKLKAQNASIEGSSTEVKGQNIKIESQASLALKGTASLKAESSGVTELKGSITKIN